MSTVKVIEIGENNRALVNPSVKTHSGDPGGVTLALEVKERCSTCGHSDSWRLMVMVAMSHGEANELAIELLRAEGAK